MPSEITKTEDQSRKTNSRFVWIFFGSLTLFVYFLGLTIPFLGPDEPRYAQVAREMLERGDWITPTLGGFNWFEKPPLLYWLEIAAYKVLGVSEFAARLGPALFGLGTVASLWFLGTCSLDASKTEKDFPRYLALIAASTFGIIVFSHAASFDIIITFPITAALVSFFVWHSKKESDADAVRHDQSIFPLALFYFFIGMGLLAKGLIGAVFPFAIVAVFYLLSRRLPSRIFLVSLFWGTLLAIVVASVWYLPMYFRHGSQFIDEFFVQHHFQRFTSNKYQHPQPFYFFLWVLPLMTLPWLPFFLGALCRMISRLFHHKDTEYKEEKNSVTGSSHGFSFSRLLTFSAAWLIVPLVFFSFSGSKLPGYILPAVPAAIVITSLFIFDLIQKSTRWRITIHFIAVSALGVAILLLIFAVPRFAETDSVKMLIQTANERGYTDNRVLTLHNTSHNAEFYAAGRLLRDDEGKQRYLSGVGEVMSEINRQPGSTLLVIVPLKYVTQLTDNEKLTTEVLKDNSELAIAAVSFK